MKKKLLTLAGIVAVLAACNNNPNPHDARFYNGQILLPDYAHDDTLMVGDAAGLNYMIKKTDPATDQEISDVLHQYCIRPLFITHPTEYHFNVDECGYDIYTEDMKKVGRICYGDNPTLDSLIDMDNQ